MSGCPTLAGTGVSGIAQALRAIDCRTSETTAYAFAHLFGASGRLLPALTLLLTLYVAFFALSLLTGRSRIGVAALTPRMLTLGVVLMFATSWAAYQNVIWTLASGAPDQIASLLTGSTGSATTLFANRLDQLFAAISDAAHQASIPGAPTETGVTPAAPIVGGFSSSTALWICAILLMLGTAGVLITSKIALAALLAIGPVFVTLALFQASRGLFEGWLKAVILFALVPLLAVLIGGGAVGALTPLVQQLVLAGGQPAPRDVAVLFLAVCVYLALMMIVVKTATTIVSGWRLPGGRHEDGAEGFALTTATVSGRSGLAAEPMTIGMRSDKNGDDRVRHIVAGIAHPTQNGPEALGGVPDRGRMVSSPVLSISGGHALPLARPSDRRIQSVGSRFRQPSSTSLSKGHVS